MTLWSSRQAGSLARAAVVIFAFVSRVQAMAGRVAIVNSFRSPTQFTCHSNVMTRQTYTATWSEIFYFAFDTASHQFWDCRVYNRGFRAAGTFRFWGDARHGGGDFFGCDTCTWSVESNGIFLYLHGVWRYKYSF